MNETIRLLARRRSLAPANLTEPGPSAAEIETLLTIASRVPDHGKLAPWRFIVFQGEARERVGRIALQIKLADDRGLAETARSAELGRFSAAPLVVAVVSRAAQPDQQVQFTTLAGLGEAAPAQAPSLLIAGWALRESAAAVHPAGDGVAATA